MNERPIIFSGEMVRAILDGRKTQTRRVMKQQPDRANRIQWPGKRRTVINIADPRVCDMSPYGQPGDKLVLKSSWATEIKYNHLPPSRLPKKARIWTLWEGEKPEWCGRTRSSRFVPKLYYDIFPKADIKQVRVERVQEISRKDVEAEGIRVKCGPLTSCSECNEIEFKKLWDSINGKKPGRSWADNPWVWVIEFERVKP